MIIEYFDCRQAIFILGARQVGKTTLLKRLMENFPEDRRYYLDLERISDRKTVEEGEDSFLQHLALNNLDLGKKNYVFIDEIQYLDDFSSFIKLMVDHHSDQIKLFLSGSSTAQIKFQFKDSLVGRKFTFHLYPLTFAEFLEFKGKSKWCENVLPPFHTWTEDPLSVVGEKLREYLIEFLVYGGYPEVAKIQNPNRKVFYLEEVMSTYVIKDIRAIFSVSSIQKFNHLVRYLALTNTQITSVNSISKEVGLARLTVDKYLKILEDTFIVSLLFPFFTNRTTELRKSPKLYFLDTGLRNAIVDDFRLPENRADLGQLFENFVFAQLLKNRAQSESLFYWRSRNRQEVDFIIKDAETLRPLEVKLSGGKLSHLKKFITNYKCENGHVVSLRQKFDREGNITTLPGYLV